MIAHASPVGGRLLGPGVKLLLVLWALGTVAGLYRFVFGLGAATNMNDGYPWGIWIAIDVVVGTGLASGGYVLAFLVFILNRGQYHPLVRPALLTSLLGYAVAGVAVAFDLGRYWSMWRIPLSPHQWSSTSVLLEVALCMMAYVTVLFLELSPAWLEGLAASREPGRAAFARRWLPRAQRALPILVAFGLLLPTMHQSSLGGLMMMAGHKLHPLWHSAFLPLFFLMTAFVMGFGVLYFESIFSSAAFGRPLEHRLLARLGRWVAVVILAFLGVRFLVLGLEGKLGLLASAGRLGFFFWGEVLLLVGAAVRFFQGSTALRPDRQLQAALLSMAGGTLYRLDVFLVAYDPGNGWVYFPSIAEILITLGLIATETVVYVLLVRQFPILAGVRSPERPLAPVALQKGVTP
ncbi:MAG: Ni/Fe-hydrogenase cytochrome b subunit [Anaeromyxobacteraceae bacterium]|nr:Ni/Fe-hydrogenase cytochrome b subunit [Anaeromyxobacteraceae bacterium]